MTKRAVQPAKRIDDRRRAGAGDNVAFTVRPGAGGLGSGSRASSITPPTLNIHQFTNRSAAKTIRGKSNGKGKRTV